MPGERFYDVIVVGAGLAGLSAAHQLMLGGKDVLVLEENRRVGGRVFSQLVEGLPIEHGAQWISPGDRSLINLATSLGLKIDQRPNVGHHLYIGNLTRTIFEGDYPRLSWRDRVNSYRLLRHLQKKKISFLEKPWLDPHADQFDRQTFGQFLKQNSLTSGYGRMICDIFESRYLNGINQVSTMEGITQWKTSPTKTYWSIAGGSDQLAKRLALEVHVLLGRKVTRVEQHRAALSVTSGQQSYQAKKVIVALPPVQAAQIDYQPAISSSKTALWKSSDSGRIIKCTLLFQQAYWKNQDWSGLAFTSERHMVNLLVDAGTRGNSPGIITTYTMGDRCLKLENLSDQQRIEVVLREIRTILKLPADAVLIRGVTYDWKTPPNGAGAYHTFRPGTLAKYGADLDRNNGSIYWASAEYDHRYRGTMEGAIRSGRNTAEKVLGMVS